ncbi:MAG: RibD family protein, partial [Planctomycetales bacterium]|nr:RibD family protein [Planctomycetales bacterium]
RALHDAILVGVNTVLSDDPRLTVRLVEGQNPQPVVVDSRLRMPTDKRLFTNHCVPPIILTSQTACEATAQQLADAGARIVRIGTLANGQLDLAEGLRRLRQLGYDSVMIEGGASIITSVLKRRLADQLVLTISPRFVAGLRAVQSSNGSPTPTMPQLKNLQYEWLEENLILRGDFDLTDQQTRSDTATCARVVVPDTTEGEGVNRS